MEGKDIYTWQQNIVIPYNQFVGSTYSGLGIPQLNQKLPINGSFYTFQQVNNFLSVSFRAQLAPPNQQIKRIKIKNISSCIMSGSGYAFELQCSDLLRYPIQFIDGSASGLVHEEYMNNKTLNTLYPSFILTLLSGSIPMYVDGMGDYDNNAIPLNGFILNPSFSFSIVYEYF